MSKLYPYADYDDRALLSRLIGSPHSYGLINPIDDETREALKKDMLQGFHFTFSLDRKPKGVDMKVGDVVRLKSGGPRATVQVVYGENSLSPGYVNIVWFEERQAGGYVFRKECVKQASLKIEEDTGRGSGERNGGLS